MKQTVCNNRMRTRSTHCPPFDGRTYNNVRNTIDRVHHIIYRRKVLNVCLIKIHSLPAKNKIFCNQSFLVKYNVENEYSTMSIYKVVKFNTQIIEILPFDIDATL